MENPIKMDDLGVPLFSETSIYCLIWGSHFICDHSFAGSRFCQTSTDGRLRSPSRNQWWMWPAGSRTSIHTKHHFDTDVLFPIGSMYGWYIYHIWLIFLVDVVKYTYHTWILWVLVWYFANYKKSVWCKLWQAYLPSRSLSELVSLSPIVAAQESLSCGKWVASILSLENENLLIIQRSICFGLVKISLGIPPTLWFLS